MTGRRLTHDEGSGEISNEETTYQNNEACHIEFAEPVMLSVYQFDVEQAYDCVYDALIVNGERYCGTSGPEGQMATSFACVMHPHRLIVVHRVPDLRLYMVKCGQSMCCVCV